MQSVLAMLMCASMLIFAVVWGLLWVGIQSDLVVLGSMVALALSSGLYMLAGALLPGAERGMWAPRGFPVPDPPVVRVEMGRMVFLGSGIWFTTGGLTALTVAVRMVVLDDPDPGLPLASLPFFLGALAVGLVITLVGIQRDQRRYEAARAAADARNRADSRP